MPRCVVCKTPLAQSPDNLYKGQFRCPDHRGTLEEIEKKRPIVWENMDTLGELVLHPILGNPNLAKSTDQVIRDQITQDWINKQRAKQKKRDEAPVYTVVTGKEIARDEINIRYGSAGARDQ